MLSIADINDSNPILILYSSGTGGEFLTKTIAANCSNINPLVWEQNSITNRTSAACVIDYGPLWDNVDDPHTWHRKMPVEQFNQLIGDNSYIFKDHPNVYFAKYHWKFLPKLKVLHFVVKKEYLYFSKLTFAKLLNRVEVTDISDEFIKRAITNTDDHQTLNAIRSWATQYTWVWEHELHIVNTQYKSCQSISIEHNDDIYYHVATQGDAIAYESNVLPQYLDMIYGNYHTIPIDCLTADSTELWNTISSYINNLDIECCIKHTNMWIENNNTVIERCYK
jgi:hypothetical protein